MAFRLSVWMVFKPILLMVSIGKEDVRLAMTIKPSMPSLPAKCNSVSTCSRRSTTPAAGRAVLCRPRALVKIYSSRLWAFILPCSWPILDQTIAPKTNYRRSWDLKTWTRYIILFKSSFTMLLSHTGQDDTFCLRCPFTLSFSWKLV